MAGTPISCMRFRTSWFIRFDTYSASAFKSWTKELDCSYEFCCGLFRISLWILRNINRHLSLLMSYTSSLSLLDKSFSITRLRKSNLTISTIEQAMSATSQIPLKMYFTKSRKWGLIPNSLQQM